MTTARPSCLAESLNGALSELMDRDSSIVLIGQDIGRLGGVFRVTRGLQSRFGTGRVRDAVLAESSIVGQAIGMSMAGLKPICEIQFDGFVYLAMNQIVTQAARMITRWNGELDLHLVVRVPVGGGIRAVEHHSESPRRCSPTLRACTSPTRRRPRTPPRCSTTRATSARR